MTPNQLVRAGIRLYGRRWKAPLARAVGRDVSMIWRYATAQAEIPRVVALAIRELLRQSPRRGQVR